MFHILLSFYHIGKIREFTQRDTAKFTQIFFPEGYAIYVWTGLEQNIGNQITKNKLMW